MTIRASIKGTKYFYFKGLRGVISAIEERLQKWVISGPLDGDGMVVIKGVDKSDIHEIELMGIPVEIITA